MILKGPICDFVSGYIKENPVRMHMPGHKGRFFMGCEERDITEVSGGDCLYQAEGIIAESEARATEIFGFGRTLYSTEGSSHCIRAMIALALSLYKKRNHGAGLQKPVIFAARNVHRAFLSACALLDVQIRWLIPEEAVSSLCSMSLAPESLRRALAAEKQKPFGVYVTSPDYLGHCQDIAALGEICKAFDVPLLVDNAHGAYLKFLQPSRHPVDLGASMSCDSAHKTLPVLTGGAYLQISSHFSSLITKQQAKNALALFGSTSPSYLVLQSLDLCNAYLKEDYPKRLSLFCEKIQALKNGLAQLGYDIYQSDPLRVVISGKKRGYRGEQLGELLRKKGVECEFCDVDALVLMLTCENRPEELELIREILGKAAEKEPLPSFSFSFKQPVQKISVREALFSETERIPVEDAVGRICGAPVISCPPAIPIALCGEMITEEMLPLFDAYNIDTIDVLTEN